MKLSVVMDAVNWRHSFIDTSGHVDTHTSVSRRADTAV